MQEFPSLLWNPPAWSQVSIFCAQPAKSRPRTLFLGAFAYSRKAPFSFVMYVRPCDRMYQLGSNWTDFREILYWAFYENL